MQTATGFKVPINADSVMSPIVHYGEPLTAIYFRTDDEQHGRITFENLDSIKVSRGEYLPYKNDQKEDEPYFWVTKVNNSEWLKARHKYESNNYGSSYEFNGNVDEMKTVFNHYIISFHDEFVEAIARGIWFEKDPSSLFCKELLNRHPFLPIPPTNIVKFEAYGLTCQARINDKDIEELKSDSIYCSQKLIEFALELDGETSIDNRLFLTNRHDKLISSLRGYFGKEIIEFENIPTLENVKPHIEAYMKEVANRRKNMEK